MALRILENLPSGARFAVIKLRSLGDCVLTTPAIRLLANFRPDLEIGVLVEERFAPIFEGVREARAILAPSLGSLRQFRPDVVLNLHGGTRSMWLTGLSGARWRAGFGHHSGSVVYNVAIPRAQAILGIERAVHTAEHLASAMFYLGVPAGAIGRAGLAGAGRKYDLSGITGPYAVIHPFASTPAKTWPAANFIAVAEHFRQQRLTPVFIGANADALESFSAFHVVKGASLQDLKSLIASASFFLANDSGPAHLAAAFDVPLLVLFGDSDSAAWRPWHGSTAACYAQPDYLMAENGLAALPISSVLEAVERIQVAH